jgi:jumonji domain-containing protein 7
MDNQTTTPVPGSPEPIAELLITYSELNSPKIDELAEPPSALEFMRYVARNRPFVIRGGASEWKATKMWNISVLKDLLKDQSVNVAVTPEGYVWIVF